MDDKIDKLLAQISDAANELNGSSDDLQLELNTINESIKSFSIGLEFLYKEPFYLSPPCIYYLALHKDGIYIDDIQGKEMSRLFKSWPISSAPRELKIRASAIMEAFLTALLEHINQKCEETKLRIEKLNEPICPE